MLVYLYISIGFGHKSKEQRLKFTTNTYRVAKILTITVILQNYFRKLSFLQNKFERKKISSHNFCCGSRKNPGRSCNMWGKGGGRAGSS
jgi:hypothetical protein